MTDTHPEAPPPGRRSFLKWCTAALGALFAAALGLPAVAYLIDPRNRPAPRGDFKTVARLSELQVEQPHQAVVRAVRRDAWTLHPSDVIGRVWLIRRDKDQVDAYTTICPHLGCSINFEPDKKHFLCPCHGGEWGLDCKKIDPANVAPRGMDQLECKVDPAQDVVQVRYQNFFQGSSVKTPKA